MLRPIAIHLPQFHPIAENDEWWGKGFTEWTNVAKAKPLFKGHYQPHLPSDLGFYDLRLEESRLAQAEMAKEYGIYGFCYYHYWFNGKRLLERPVNDILRTGKPDFPFMLCWANENWSRRWDGSEHLMLMEQKYSAKDARDHCLHLLPFFADPRYIRVENKPFFAFYKPGLIPNLTEYIDVFRETAFKEAGISLYLGQFETTLSLQNPNDSQLFDTAIEFQPHSRLWQEFMNKELWDKVFSSRVKRYTIRIMNALGQRHRLSPYLHRVQYNLDYQEYVKFLIAHYVWPKGYKRFPGITPMWDNTARRGKSSFLFSRSTPESYKEWMDFLIKNFTPYTEQENFLFINAWNEWAEGNHLEPCQKWGRQYLIATKQALSQQPTAVTMPT